MAAQAAQPDPVLGKRFATLKQAFQCAVGAACSEISLEEFGKFFPTLSAPQRSVAYDAYRQVLHLMRANSEAEYEDIVEECQLWSKLATLEQMCTEQGLDAHGGVAAGSASASGATPPPAEVATRSRVAAMTAEREVLAAQLAKLEQQRTEVAAAIDAKQRQAADAAVTLQAVPQQLGGIAEAGRAWNAQPAA